MRNEKGLSLVETLISVAVLGILAVGFLGALMTDLRGSVLADTRATSEALAKSEVEYIKTVSYTDAPWSYQLPAAPPDWDLTHALPSGYTGYTLDASASILSGQGEDIQQITVTITKSTSTYTIIDYKVNY